MKNDRHFISYSRKNLDFATQIAKDLRSKGVNIWFDQLDIEPGSRWDQEIEKGLKDCKAIILLLSPGSVASQNVLDEVSYAIDEGKPVIPVLHQTCDIPFRLRRIQYIDFTPGYEIGFPKLMEAIDENYESAAATQATTRPANSEKENKTFSKTVSTTKAAPVTQSAPWKKPLMILGLLLGLGLVGWMFSGSGGSSSSKQKKRSNINDLNQSTIKKPAAPPKEATMLMPNLVNEIFNENRARKIKSMDLTFEFIKKVACDIPKNTIIQQNPIAGTAIKKGTVVKLMISDRNAIKGPKPNGEKPIKNLRSGDTYKENAWALKNTNIVFSLSGDECTVGKLILNHPLAGQKTISLKAGQLKKATQFFGAGQLAFVFSSDDPNARLALRVW